MEKELLIKRINQKEEQIAKAKRLLDKYLPSCSSLEQTVINQFLETGEYKLHHGLGYSDAWSKAVDLYESRLTVQKYLNQLKAIESKESITKIDIIWQFLLNYKELVSQYIRENIKVLDQYYNKNSELCEYHNNNSYKVYRGELSREEYNQTYNRLLREERELKNEIHPYTFKVSVSNGRGNPHTVNEEELNKILLKDIESRYWKLIDEVTKYTGEITSAKQLSITNGELNGIINGVKGSAKINTIGAGGYNIQCFHYRTLVKPVK